MTDNGTYPQFTDCVPWAGPVNQGGYGVARIGQTTTTAHRVAWIKVNGPIPDGLQLDHLCRNRRCVNVDHLELVTPKENTRRAPRYQATECPHGHPLTGSNLYVQVGPKGTPWRSCNVCRREAQRRYEERRRRAG